MDHEAYENQMIDNVNQNAEEKRKTAKVSTPEYKIITKKDVAALKLGLKRVALALITAFVFGMSVFTFITVATAPGYLAVFLFIAAIVMLGMAFLLLYAQGLLPVESKGDSK